MSNPPVPVQEAQKPSLSDLWKDISVKPSAIAICAEVPMQVIEDMLVCRPVELEDAKKVLEEISILLRKECTLESVYVPLTEQTGA